MLPTYMTCTVVVLQQKFFYVSIFVCVVHKLFLSANNCFSSLYVCMCVTPVGNFIYFFNNNKEKQSS